MDSEFLPLHPDAWQVCSWAEKELDHGSLKAEVHNYHLFKEEMKVICTILKECQVSLGLGCHSFLI